MVQRAAHLACILCQLARYTRCHLHSSTPYIIYTSSSMKRKRLNFFNLMCSSLKVGVYILIILRGKGMGMLYNNRGYYVCAIRIDDRVHSIGSGGGGAGCL